MLTQKILMGISLIDHAVHKRLSNKRKARFWANRGLTGIQKRSAGQFATHAFHLDD